MVILENLFFLRARTQGEREQAARTQGERKQAARKLGEGKGASGLLVH